MGSSKVLFKSLLQIQYCFLKKNVVTVLESASIDSIQKHVKTVWHYMFAYLEELSGGSELEKLV